MTGQGHNPFTRPSTFLLVSETLQGIVAPQRSSGNLCNDLENPNEISSTTGYLRDCRGIMVRLSVCGIITHLSTTFRSVQGTIQPPIKWEPKDLSMKYSGWSKKLTANMHLVSYNGSIGPLHIHLHGVVLKQAQKQFYGNDMLYVQRTG